ncbi:MAG: TetR/AcrR family transcriptional regulator [Oscillospiraceae bacterium]
MLKDEIVDASIQSLRREGLRFSVDLLAERLKISKKTIYKYFPNKEALAYAIYERYYAGLNDEVQARLRRGGPETAEALLLCYFDSAKMVRREIFNKYALNHVIGEFALQRHAALWETVRPHLCGGMTGSEAGIYKLIIDGAFDRAIACDADAAAVIGMLRRIP